MHRDDPAAAELVEPELSRDQRRVLASGLNEWGGPVRPGVDIIVAMGFKDVDDLYSTGHRMFSQILNREPMSRLDWTRALVATEIVFVSDVVGGALDWEPDSNFYDQTTLRLLREIQHSLSLVDALVMLQSPARSHQR